jgi:hypothetical protein
MIPDHKVFSLPVRSVNHPAIGRRITDGKKKIAVCIPTSTEFPPRSKINNGNKIKKSKLIQRKKNEKKISKKPRENKTDRTFIARFYRRVRKEP